MRPSLGDLMSRQPPTILYVEDNIDNRVLVKRILEAEGYIVLEAGNVNEGLNLIYEQYPSLVLVDINLPEIDGLALTAHLREDPRFDDTPIVAITADVIRGNEERTYSAGCNGYIQKPIDVDRLTSLIKQFIDPNPGGKDTEINR
jgi:two-component system cell cycle response regulator DivK